MGVTAWSVGSCILRKMAGKFFPPLRRTFFPSSVEVPRCPKMGSSLWEKEGSSKSLPIFQISLVLDIHPILWALSWIQRGQNHSGKDLSVTLHSFS